MRKSSEINAAAAVVVAIALTLLVSCGSSKKSSSTGTKASPPSTTGSASKPASSPALVTAKKTDKLGTVLADKAGMTLYTLTKDGKAVDCTGPCLQAWPPLVAPAGVSTPKGAPGISGLSIAKGSGGTSLVAAGGLPLYHFIKDKDSEDAYGEGIASFGGVWHVSKTSATPTPLAEDKSSETTTPTSEGSTSSSGY